MNEIYPIAKLGDQILIVNKDDVPYIGKERALEVKCIKVDLKHRVIDPLIELEKHLKFNPWEEITDKERDIMLQELGSKFSDEEILGKIMEPLAESLITF
ncbi:MAG: hypothetical protein Q8R20_03775 [Nanoarchaeota archaeon]|nr:hypothetical protein [Nanoarchaeota archaeon]